MIDFLDSTATLGFLVATVRMSTPLLLAATGEMIAERAGVLNLGVEGMMLTGALCGFLGVYYTGSLPLGWALAALAGVVVALVFAGCAITFRAHQVIVALGVNLLTLGTTGFVYRLLFGLSSSAPQIEAAVPVTVPVLGAIPWLGPIFFRHTVLVYFAFAVVPLTWWLLYRTPAGLVLRSVGENAVAADTVGVGGNRVRYIATAIGGAFAGLAGAYLSTVSLNVFLEGMTGGAGWIAVAIVIFGNWRPFGIVAAALIFGGAEALQLRMQSAGVGIPREFIIMLPYLLTLLALAGVMRRSQPPAQLCIPFVRA
jgi:general nucleoside transport system permease protein